MEVLKMSDRIFGRDRRPANFILVLLALGIFCGGCEDSGEVSTQEVVEENSNRIFAASYALQYLTQRVAGEGFQVEFPAADSDDPKKWSPDVESVAAMQKSDLIVVNGPGAAYAGWLERTTLPATKICKTCDDFKLGDYITVKNYQIVHAHGPEGEHSHPYFVPYPWLDPQLAIKQSEKVCSALSTIHPDRKEVFETNLRALKKDLKELASLIQSGNGDSRPRVVTTNPFPKFLTRAAGIQDRHLLWMQASDLENQQAAIDQLKKQLVDFQAKHVLVGGELPSSLTDEMKKNPAEVHVLDLLDFEPANGDFLDACRKNIQTLNGIK